jgi:RimJ/RimL family protein N-acetyltransferase
MTPLHSDEVVLRDAVESDLPIFFEHQRDPEASRMAAFPPRERDAFMAHWGNILKDETVIKKAIVLNGELAGNVVSFDASGERLLGYWLGKEYWGQGIASVAVARFLIYEKTRPLYARVATHNFGSIRVLEKNGFTISGENKFISTSGEPIEEFIMELENAPSSADGAGREYDK